jgi:hypothetical protein
LGSRRREWIGKLEDFGADPGRHGQNGALGLGVCSRKGVLEKGISESSQKIGGEEFHRY